MEIKQVKKVVLIMDEGDAEQLNRVVDKLNAVDTAVDGNCQSCPFMKVCKTIMQEGVCYIHATKLLLMTMAGGSKPKPDNQREDEFLS